MATAVDGVLSYLGADALGSATVALDASGTAQAAQLAGPYGATRYSSGAMPGSYGFAGPRADAASGLDDDVAREIDLATQVATEHLTARAQPRLGGRPPRPHRTLRRRFVYRLCGMEH